MDYVKRDTNLFDTMHFVDFPYNIHNDIEGPQPESTNAVSAIINIGNSLFFSKKNSQTWGKAFSTLALLHFVGDMHQPLHAAALFSDLWKFRLPFGDRGGNDFKCKYTSETGMTYTQIHLLYDCLGGLHCDYMPITMTPEYEKLIKDFVDDLMEKYPITKYDPEVLTPSNMFDSKSKFGKVIRSWAEDESFVLAKKLYDQLTPGEELTPAFIAELRPILLERVAMAGYRLAYILDHANFSKNGPEPNFAEKQIYQMIVVGVTAFFIIAIIVACIYRHKYTEAKEDAYVNIANIQQE